MSVRLSNAARALINGPYMALSPFGSRYTVIRYWGVQ